MTSVRTVVFDLDGTLVDTAPDLINALNFVLDREGLPPVPLESARTMIGAGARKLIERGLELEGRAATRQRHHPAHRRLHRLLCGPYRRRFASVRRASKARSMICRRADIASRSAPTSWNGCRSCLLDRLGLSSRFAAICGADTFGISKPDPVILRQTIARAGGQLSTSIMVGDAGPDIGVARRAGIPVIGVEFGYTEVPIAELKPDRLIGHMRELPAAVESLMLHRELLLSILIH